MPQAMPKFTARPAGRSVFSDIANAGAGFAQGIAKERDKRKAESIDAAMRAFDQQMKTEQLGLQREGVNLQEQSLISQNNAQAAQDADRLIGREIQKRELAAVEARNKQQAEADRLDREFKHTQLKAEIGLGYARIAAEERMKRYEVADQGARSLVNQLNTHADNLKAQYNDFIRDNADIADARFDYTNTVTRLTNELKKNAVLKPDGSIDAVASAKNPNFNRINDKLGKISELRDIMSKRQETMDRIQEVVMKGRDIRKQGGIPDTGFETSQTGPRWRDFTPEQQQASVSALAQHIKNKTAAGEPVDYDKFLDIGMPSEEVEKARNMAGLVMQQEVEQAQMQAQPSNSIQGTGPAFQSTPNALSTPSITTGPAQGTGPAFQSSPQSLPAASKPASLPSTSPRDAVGTSVDRRSPIFSGPLSALSPNFKPSPFAFDTSRHRIMQPSIGPRRPF